MWGCVYSILFEISDKKATINVQCVRNKEIQCKGQTQSVQFLLNL